MNFQLPLNASTTKQIKMHYVQQIFNNTAFLTLLHCLAFLCALISDSENITKTRFFVYTQMRRETKNRDSKLSQIENVNVRHH